MAAPHRPVLCMMKKAEFHGLQPALGCPTAHRCQRAPGDGNIRAGHGPNLIAQTETKRRCGKGNASGLGVSGNCLLENARFPPRSTGRAGAGAGCHGGPRLLSPGPCGGAAPGGNQAERLKRKIFLSATTFLHLAFKEKVLHSEKLHRKRYRL